MNNRRYGIYYAASAYLLYLVYGIVSDIKNGVSDNVPFSIGIAVFFVLAAAVISLYAYRKSKAEKAAEAEKAAAEEKALKEKEAEEESEDESSPES